MDLFDPWPERPQAHRAEQREIPLGGTIAQRYEAWRDTEDGQAAYRWMQREAIRDVQAGTKRLSAKSLAERCRAVLHVRFDNRYTPEIAREIQEMNPTTRGLFELRRRTAA